MGDVIKFRKPSASARAQGKTLCKSGFHKWTVVKDRQFDVQRGRLVTQLRCARCGVQKTELL